MIRKLNEMTTKELDEIMLIWLKSNKEAHPFVSAKYWEDNVDVVREMLPKSEIYVYETDKNIAGFVGLMGDYIAGIFVNSADRGKGIGKSLLDKIKNENDRLELSVYQKNEGAYSFYLREGFKVKEEALDEDNQEIEYLMTWTK